MPQSNIMKNITMLAACAATTAAVKAVPQIRITEFMYTGLFGEYVEIANIGDTEQNMTGWSFSDNSRIVGDTSLSEIGTLSPGEAAIITEVSDALFTLVWYTEPGEPALPASNIIANNTSNLGRSDETNIYPNGAFDGDNDCEDASLTTIKAPGPLTACGRTTSAPSRVRWVPTISPPGCFMPISLEECGFPMALHGHRHPSEASVRSAARASIRTIDPSAFVPRRKKRPPFPEDRRPNPNRFPCGPGQGSILFTRKNSPLPELGRAWVVAVVVGPLAIRISLAPCQLTAGFVLYSIW